MSSDGQIITGVVYGGSIWVSTDNGISWNERYISTQRWISIAMSADGQYQLATATSTGQCASSSNYGASWTLSYGCSLSSASYNFQVAMDDSGQHRAVAVNSETYVINQYVQNGWFYLTSNYASSWTRFTQASIASFFPYAVGISGAGKYQMAGDYYGSIYYSADYGSSWTRSTSTSAIGWTSIGIDYNGTYAHATSYDQNTGGIYRSVNYGQTWSKVYSGNFFDVANDDTGQYWIATDSLYLYQSSDYGVSWAKNQYIPITNTFTYGGIAMNGDGSVWTVCGYGKCVYLSRDYGRTWSACVDTARPTTSPTFVTASPSFPPTRAPSGPSAVPTIAPTIVVIRRPSPRPSTARPTTNGTGNNDDGYLGVSVSGISTTSLTTTNIAIIAILIILIVCCGGGGWYYFYYVRNSPYKLLKEKAKKKKRKKGSNDKDEEYVEVVRVKGGGIPNGASEIDTNPTHPDGPLNAAEIRRKRKGKKAGKIGQVAVAPPAPSSNEPNSSTKGAAGGAGEETKVIGDIETGNNNQTSAAAPEEDAAGE